MKSAALDESEKSQVKIVNFANAIIFDENEAQIKTGTLWQKQTVLFIFLRHFGCISCRGVAVEVWKEREKYEKKGAKIVFVGNGQPQYIKTFKQDLGLQDAPIYTDPELRAFQAAGFRRGFLVSLGGQSIPNGLKLRAKGHRQGKTEGDLWQLGGVLVVTPTGRVAYHYISQATGDYPPSKDLGY